MEVAEIAGPGRGQGSLIYLRRRRALLELVVEQEQVLIEMLVLVLLVLVPSMEPVLLATVLLVLLAFTRGYAK